MIKDTAEVRPEAGNLKHYKWTDDNIAWLRARAEEGLSANEIASLLGVTRVRVSAACVRFGVTLRGRPGRKLSGPAILVVTIPAAERGPVDRFAARSGEDARQVAARLFCRVLQRGDAFIEGMLADQ